MSAMGSPTASSAAVYQQMQQMQQMQQLLQTGTPGGAAAALEAAAAAALPALNESQSEMAAVIDNMDRTDVQMTLRGALGQNSAMFYETRQDLIDKSRLC